MKSNDKKRSVWNKGENTRHSSTVSLTDFIANTMLVALFFSFFRFERLIIRLRNVCAQVPYSAGQILMKSIF